VNELVREDERVIGFECGGVLCVSGCVLLFCAVLHFQSLLDDLCCLGDGCLLFK
jgi:hypothetical protein